MHSAWGVQSSAPSLPGSHQRAFCIRLPARRSLAHGHGLVAPGTGRPDARRYLGVRGHGGGRAAATGRLRLPTGVCRGLSAAAVARKRSGLPGGLRAADLPRIERLPGPSVRAASLEAACRLRRHAAFVPTPSDDAVPRGLHAVADAAGTAPLPPVRHPHRRRLLERPPCPRRGRGARSSPSWCGAPTRSGRYACPGRAAVAVPIRPLTRADRRAGSPQSRRPRRRRRSRPRSPSSPARERGPNRRPVRCRACSPAS